MARKDAKAIQSILILDDDDDTLSLLSELLEERLDATVVGTKFPSDAVLRAQKEFFDIVLVDVTLNYQGSMVGGLDVYRQLLPRYGRSSLLAYSQLITDELLKRYDCAFNFLEKDDNPIRFIESITKEATTLREAQTYFVAMPFSPDYDVLYGHIARGVKSASYQCTRVDLEEFTKSIVERIFTEIRDAKGIVFLSTDKNPNAFYEAGYAAALRKEIITVTDDFKNLPFDLRDRNAISYDSDPDLARKAFNKAHERANSRQAKVTMAQHCSAPRAP